MLTVKEVSRISGVSVRTLHHYDSIGLLRPAAVTEAGYRLYDEESLVRLKSILLLRYLRFSLKDILKILDSEDFDPVEAVAQQIRLLELQRQQLDVLIAHAREIQRTGVITVDFTPFDTAEMDAYAAEAKQRWGKSKAYGEYERKNAGKSKEELHRDGEGLMAIFAQFGAIRHLSPASREAQTLVEKLQSFISAHYYNCTGEILRGLGQMFIADERMKENIDRAGGEGTAWFACEAIKVYCK